MSTKKILPDGVYKADAVQAMVDIDSKDNLTREADRNIIEWYDQALSKDLKFSQSMR